VIAAHPATEMDYRRRVTRRLGDAEMTHHALEQPLSIVISDVLARLY